ncbi:hypothetical protein GOACH_03_02050 [Gordonia aichiensis NBRC 108223]|uniref:Uncharacterized protein n=1 Tax=Gordonia aichiensis NBRC 108223 TaxID=1220583 RepID=L7KGW8_9ACTN|nr:hypothetical protein GOACH_03_02050 [Gordonia aichiensis NBRC 108223]
MIPVGRKLYRALTAAAVAGGATASTLLTAGGAAHAAPAPDPKIPAASISQTPNAGVATSGDIPFAAYVAPIAAASPDPDTLRVWLEPMPGDACSKALRAAVVGVEWRNTVTRKSGTATFPACKQGKPALSPPLRTGPGPISFTTSVVGRGGATFTLSPGSGTISR